MRIGYILFFIPLLIASCSSLSNQSDFKNQEIFSVDGQPISAEEFIYVYEKNNFNNQDIYSEEDVLSYLDLFINFKLKVREAKAEGVDTTKSFIDEFKSYQTELIKPYLLETRETDSLAWQAYQRMQNFIHASHILISIDKNDTTKAYEKITALKKLLDEGADFNELAMNKSEDPSAKQNRGDLGLFTTMRMVYPFENAAYTTPVGEVSDIFRTQFGYHILKVHERFENKGKIKIAHIVISKNNPQNQDPEGQAYDVLDQLEAGGDWDYFCKQYSADEQTKNKGGLLNYFGQGQLPPNFKDFEEKVFSLDSIGIIAGPIESPYGWHIVKLIDKKPLESFDELKESLKAQATRGERAKVKKELIIGRLKEASNFSQNDSLLTILPPYFQQLVADSMEINSIPESLLNQSLFTINNIDFSTHSILKELTKESQKNTINTPSFSQLYSETVEEKLFDFEEERIRQEHLEYRMLEKEYYEGLMLFDIMEKYVWGNSAIDSAELTQFFNKNINNYQWENRVKASIILLNDPSIAEEIIQKINSDSIVYYNRTVKLQDFGRTIENIKKLTTQYQGSHLTIRYNDQELGHEAIDSIVHQLINSDLSKENIHAKADNTLKDELFLAVSTRSCEVLSYLYNKNSELNVSVESGTFEAKDRPILSKIEWTKGIKQVSDSTGITVVKIDEVLPSSAMQLNEVRGMVISDFQKELEKNWITSLKEKYPVVKNKEVITKTLKYFENK